MNRNNSKRQTGVTLLELLVVVALIGILGMLGYPAYTASIVKAQRADGMDALLRLSDRIEEYYLNNSTYADASAATLLGTANSKEGFYTLAVTSADAFKYVLTATRVGTDAACGNLILNSLGQKTASTGATDCW